MSEQQADDTDAIQSPIITSSESQIISPLQQSPPPAAAAPREAATAAEAPNAAAAPADAATVPPPRARRVRSVRRAESLVSYLPSARSQSAPSQWSWTHEEVFSTPPDPQSSATDDAAAAAAVTEATQSLLDDDDEMFDVDIDALVAAATSRSKDNGAQQQISVMTETTISVTVIEAQSAGAAASAVVTTAAATASSSLNDSVAAPSLSTSAVAASRASSFVAPKSLLDDADDAMFDSVDIDALVAAATARHKGGRKSVKVSREAAIDLTDDSAPENAHPVASIPAAAVASAAPASMDIEDIAALCASTAASASAAAISSVAAAAAADPLPTPLSLRNPTEPLAVTRFCELSWCELQLDFSLRLGKRAPSAAAQAVMDRGSAIHLEYELETTTHVEVQPESNEDVWALRIINMMLGLQELTATGRTREFPVFGCVRTPKPERGSKPHAGSSSTPQPRWVWITGIVDEIVRADVFARDQWHKQQARDELVAEEAAEKARAEAHRKPPLSRTKSEGPTSAFDTKRKRTSRDVQTPVASASPVLAMRAASSAASSAAPAPSSSALVDRTASFSQASLNPDEEWQIERQITAELEQGSKENTRPQNAASAVSPTSSASAASPKSAASGAGSPMSLASASPIAAPSSSSSPAPSSNAAAASAARFRPRPPTPDFPVSDRYLVLDHKTRMANSLPMQSQKAATYLQVSIYKHLIDRWMGPPNSNTETKMQHTGKAKDCSNSSSGQDEQKHSSGYPAAASAASSTSDDLFLAPPFPLSLFYSHFSLDPRKPLCESLRSHLDSCGLSRDFTLEDLLNFLLSMSKSSPQTDREMKVEYQWQKDKRVSAREAHNNHWLLCMALALTRFACACCDCVPLLQLIGADSYTFDAAWFRDEMDYCLKCQKHSSAAVCSCCWKQCLHLATTLHADSEMRLLLALLPHRLARSSSPLCRVFERRLEVLAMRLSGCVRPTSRQVRTGGKAHPAANGGESRGRRCCCC